MREDEVYSENHGNGQIVNTIINDPTAKWVVIVFLAFGVAYAVVGEGASEKSAAHAQMDADLAKYYATDLKVYMAEQGLHPPSEPWAKPKPKPKEQKR